MTGGDTELGPGLGGVDEVGCGDESAKVRSIAGWLEGVLDTYSPLPAPAGL